MPNTNSDLVELKVKIDDRLELLENTVSKLGVSLQNAKNRAFPSKTQTITLDGMTKALCVETIDPRKENRVRFYHPRLHYPGTPVLALPFAKPISAMGGFDDCGLSWVPPARSTLCIIHENGSRDSPHYLGTTWHVDRGSGGQDLKDLYPLREWDSVYSGHRKGYLVGKNDESQVLPPWNTESANGNDIRSTVEFIEDPNEQKRTTYPNIYGFKTPEKHMFKMTDGNAKCNRRWKRVEIQSGCGNYMLFKDDHLHYGGQWGHTSCGAEGSGVEICSEHTGDIPILTDPHGKPIEGPAGCRPNCDSTSGKQSCERILGGHPSTPTGTLHEGSQKGANPFFKHENECRPIRGPGTPQNNKIDLPQSGVQILSISGQSFVMDDSVEEPQGIPNWERSISPFDFGCNDLFLGRIEMKSATGHKFGMYDTEEDTNQRGEENKIEMLTATGNLFQMNDHSLAPSGGSGEGEKCLAGEKRGIHLVSTSKHEIHMVDDLNEQCSPPRTEGGQPESKSTQAYVQVISGYGLETRWNDDNDQQDTQRQFIQILHPQRARSGADPNANIERGPHFMRFQGRPQGEPGVIFLRAGGHSVRSTYDMDVVLVGDKEKNPSDKFTYVSKMFITATEDVHFRYSGELHIFFAEKQILLMAGRDCPPPEGKRCKGPCVYPVIIARCPVICPLTGITHWTEKAISERVFASGHHPCQTPPDCGTGCAAYFAAMAVAPGPPCEEAETTDIDTGAVMQLAGYDASNDITEAAKEPIVGYCIENTTDTNANGTFVGINITIE